MKICILCYRGNPYSGGQGIYLKYIAEEMVRQGHEIHIVVGPPYPTIIEGVHVHYIHNNEYYIKGGTGFINRESPFDIFKLLNLYEYSATRLGAFSEISTFSFRAFVLVRKLHEKYGFDVIHDNQCLGYGLLLMKSLGIPVIATIHHPLTVDMENVLERASSFRNKLKGVMFYPVLMQRIVSKRLDHIITVSEDSRRRIRMDFGVPLEMQTVVYNGMDTDVFKPLKGIRKKKNQILFVGNVEDGKKGFVYLARAMKRVKSPVVLTVVDGGAPHRRITMELVRRLGINDRIRFTGKASTADLVKLYSESEFAVVPSVYEGFGLPAAEAMACGISVISSDGGALPEVVGDAGVIVPARDEVALASAIDDLMCDKKKKKELGVMGRERIQREFRWQNAVVQMIGVYRRFTVSGEPCV